MDRKTGRVLLIAVFLFYNVWFSEALSAGETLSAHLRAGLLFNDGGSRQDILPRIKDSWGQKMSQGSIFRYGLSELQAVRKGKIIALYNPARKGRRPAQMEPTGLDVPFDDSKFNYTKINPEEVIMADVDMDGVSTDIVVNVSPLAKGSLLFTPERMMKHNQCFNEKAARTAFSILEKFSRTSYKVGFNSLGGFASINHLHLQGMDMADVMPGIEKMPIENEERKHLFVKDGVNVSELPKWPLTTLVLSSNDTWALKEQLLDVIGILHENNQPYNLLFTYDKKTGQYAVYIVIRKPQRPAEYGTGIAWIEVSGLVLFVDRDDRTHEESVQIFNTVTEEDIFSKELAPHSIEREGFDNIINTFKQGKPALSSAQIGESKTIARGIRRKEVVLEDGDTYAKGKAVIMDLGRVEIRQYYVPEAVNYDFSKHSASSKFDSPEAPFLPFPGKVFRVFLNEVDPYGKVIAASNSLQSNFFSRNDFLIVNGEVISKSSCGVFEKEFTPLEGEFLVFSFDKGDIGIKRVNFINGEINDVGKGIKNGIAGLPLVLEGKNAVHLIESAFPALKGNQTPWKKPQEVTSAISCLGKDKYGNIVLLHMAGDPNDEERKEPTLGQMADIMIDMGVVEAIALGTSQDVNQYLKGDEALNVSAKPRAGSAITDYPNGRPLGAIITFELKEPTRLLPTHQVKAGASI